MRSNRPFSSLLTGRSVTWASVVINTALTALKFLAGLVSGSQTILADGLHSGSDLVTDVAVLVGLDYANRPADRAHPYGHHRITALVAMFVGVVLLVAGAYIALKAIMTLRNPIQPIEAVFPFWVAAASIPIKELLYQITAYVGRKTSDLSLLANAWHHRSDAFTSVAAAAGLGGAMLGGASWAMLDSVTALVLSAFLVVVAVQISLSSIAELLDRAPSAETLEGIRGAVAATRGVRGYHAVRARQAGGRVEMDIHVQVDPSLTVKEGHDIASAVKYAAMGADAKVVAVIVHVEPAK